MVGGGGRKHYFPHRRRLWAPSPVGSQPEVSRRKRGRLDRGWWGAEEAGVREAPARAQLGLNGSEETLFGLLRASPASLGQAQGPQAGSRAQEKQRSGGGSGESPGSPAERDPRSPPWLSDNQWGVRGPGGGGRWGRGMC